ncbi:MAG: GtrA family protein [Candidatus Dojkabacteria bacterium]|nr:GtrA family protein [Candidatus Dojkabacteria bacterium]
MSFLKAIFKTRYEQFFTYILTGLISFFVDFGAYNVVFFVLINFGSNREMSSIIGNFIGMILGLITSFIGNQKYVFNKSKDTMMSNFSKYTLLFLFNYFASSGLIIVLSYFLSFILDIFNLSSTDLNYSLSKFLVMFILIFWNFFMYKKVIFK